MTNMSSQNIGLFHIWTDADSNRSMHLHISFLNSWTEEQLQDPSQIYRSSSSLTLRKGNLCDAYDAIQTAVFSAVCYLGSQNQFYMPGSVLTSHGGTLVGRVPIIFNEWNVYWEASDGDTTILSFLSTPKSVVTSILYLLANCSLTAVQ